MGAGPAVVRLTIETRFSEGGQDVTERRRLYFDVSAVKLDSGTNVPDARVHIGPPARLGLPAEIGWYHADRVVNNETTHPGYGFTVAYSAPSAKMSIYAYDRGMGEAILQDPEVAGSTEFASAVQDFLTVNPEAIPVDSHEWGGVHLKTFDVGDAYSAVLVAPFSELFLKLRLTFEGNRDRIRFECAQDTIGQFAQMVRGSH